jgi:pilus assembly protein Flp/PilA
LDFPGTGRGAQTVRTRQAVACRARNQPTENNVMLQRIRNFLVNEDGPTATEYAVMLALIVCLAVGAITALGNKVSAIFTSVDSQINP